MRTETTKRLLKEAKLAKNAEAILRYTLAIEEWPVGVKFETFQKSCVYEVWKIRYRSEIEALNSEVAS